MCIKSFRKSTSGYPEVTASEVSSYDVSPSKTRRRSIIPASLSQVPAFYVFLSASTVGHDPRVITHTGHLA